MRHTKCTFCKFQGHLKVLTVISYNLPSLYYLLGFSFRSTYKVTVDAYFNSSDLQGTRAGAETQPHPHFPDPALPSERFSTVV